MTRTVTKITIQSRNTIIENDLKKEVWQMTVKPFTDDCSLDEIKQTLNEIRFPVELAIYNDDLDKENYFNSGAIIRVSHCFLAKKLHFIKRKKYYRKAAMGCRKYEDIAFYEDEQDFLQKNGHRNLVAFEKRDNIRSVQIGNYKYPSNPILFFGCEKFGVPQSVLDAACACVTIPMFGLTNDLNLAIATGIALHDYVTKYTQKQMTGALNENV